MSTNGEFPETAKQKMQIISEKDCRGDGEVNSTDNRPDDLSMTIKTG